MTDIIVFIRAAGEPVPSKRTFEMTDIIVFIRAAGDPSVGIPSATWEINLGEMDIADVQEDFRNALGEAFGILAGERVGVSFDFEQRQEPAE